MAQILLSLAGLIGGLALVALVLLVAILWARRAERSKRSCLADPSHTVDHGPSIIGTDSGPFGADGGAGNVG